jgi:hypothetical protein
MTELSAIKMRVSSPSHKFVNRIRFLFPSLWLALQPFAAHAATTVDTDQHIRAIVESMLREKDKKIEQLEARILQMEQDNQNTAVKTESKVVADNAVPPVQPETHVAKAAAEKQEAGITGKLKDLGEEVLELKEATKDKGLDISGFFDVNAKTDNATEQTFSVGSVELDLEYA